MLLYKDIKVYRFRLWYNAGDGKMNTDLKLFSMKELFSKLHNDIKAFISITKDTAERNNEISFGDVSELREHITERLNQGENVEDNRMVLKVLNLFTTDKAFVQITGEEAEGWLNFLDAIENSLKNLGEYATTPEERNDIKELNDALSKAKELLRK